MALSVTLPPANGGPVIASTGSNGATNAFATAGGANLQQGTQVVLVVHVPGLGQQTVGYVQRVDQSDSYGTAAFYGLGQITPLEIDPLQFTGQLTLTGARLYTQGWLGALFGSAEEILQSGALNVAVYNFVTKNFDVVYVGFVPQTYTAAYAANAFTIQTATGIYRTLLMNSSNWNPQGGSAGGLSSGGFNPSIAGAVIAPSQLS